MRYIVVLGGLVWLLLSMLAPNARADITFKSTQLLSANVDSAFFGPVPQAIALKDLNGDNYPDIALVDENQDAVDIFYYSPATSSYPSGPQETYGTGANPVAVTTGNFNGDGLPDLAVVAEDDNTITTMLNNGSGFDTQNTYPLNPDDACPIGVVAADLDGDGIDDLAVLGDSTVYLLKGNGDGTFSPFPTPSINTGSFGAFAIAAGTFVSSPPNIDLAISNQDGGDIAILLGNGDGTFQAAKNIYGSWSGPAGLAIADLNGDGNNDIAFVDAYAIADLNVDILRGDGTGNFTPSPDGPATAQVDSLAMAAGNFDKSAPVGQTVGLAVTSMDDGTGAALLCQPSANCPSELHTFDGGFVLDSLPSVNGLGQVAVQEGDINRDGLPDLVMLSNDGSQVGVFLNTTGGGTLPTDTPTPATSGTAAPTPTPSTPAPTSTPQPTTTPLPTVTATPIPTAPYGVCNTPLSGSKPVAVAVGNANGAGNQFIAVADNQGNKVIILQWNIQMGAPDPCGYVGLNHNPGLDVTGITAPVAVATADFDNDGKLDLAVVGSAGLSVFFGDGTGHFVASGANPMPVGGTPSSISTADFNKDGLTDIIVANSATNAASIFLGTGNRSFTAACPVSVGRNAALVVAQNLNLGGQPDFAVASAQTSQLLVFLQLPPATPGTAGSPSCSAVSFRALTPMQLTGSPEALVAAGFKPTDTVASLLAIALSSTDANGSLAVFSGTSTSGSDLQYQAASPVQIPTPEGGKFSIPSALGVGDINQDGRNDLIVADKNNSDIVVFPAASDGTFKKSLIPLAVQGLTPVGMAVQDIDGDGIPDVITANSGDGSVSVLISGRPPATPTPLPSATPTMTGTPTDTPTPSETPTPSPTASPSPSATGTRTAIPSRTPTTAPTETPHGVVGLSGSCAIEPGSPHGSGILILAALALGAGIVRRRAALRGRKQHTPSGL